MKVACIVLMLVAWAPAVTKELVRVFQPLSLHGTDSSSAVGVKGVYVQAEVVPRPMILSGAFPEDLIKAVAAPCRLSSNNPQYEVPETNLFVLCQTEILVEREERTVLVTLDCSEFVLPEEIELKEREVLSLMVEGVRRTLRNYYRDSGQEAFTCDIRLAGLGKELEGMDEMNTKFEVAPVEVEVVEEGIGPGN